MTREVLQYENEGERDGGPNGTDTHTNQATAPPRQGTDLIAQQEPRQEPTNTQMQGLSGPGPQTQTTLAQTTLDTFLAVANRQQNPPPTPNA